MKDVDGALDDKGDSRNNAKFNLFSSEFVNNLTELAFEEPTQNEDAPDNGQESMLGHNGL